jgi:hypothetical protein
LVARGGSRELALRVIGEEGVGEKGVGEDGERQTA